MRIGIVHRSKVSEVRTLSGTPYYMVKALQEHVGEVVFLSADGILARGIEFAGKVLNRLSCSLFGRRLSSDHHRVLSRQLARTIGLRVVNSGCDVIFAPFASAEVAYLTTNLPMIYCSDLNWSDIVDYYPGCSSLYEFARAEGERIDAAALGKASALIYPSPWAARTAIEHYHVDARKVHMVPCGANFEAEDIPPREAAWQHSLDGGIGLLWIGVDWERKGGSIAYDCLMELLRRGVDARLVVCGCVPPEQFRHPQIEVIAFLSKRDAAQRARLSRLFLEATFFLFPTMAEAFGIVLCEASAHGLPSLVRNTGGVGGAVSDGVNGFLMAPDAKGREYAEKILEIVRNLHGYDALVRRCRAVYEETLNWDAWGRAVKPMFEQAARGERL